MDWLTLNKLPSKFMMWLLLWSSIKRGAQLSRLLCTDGVSVLALSILISLPPGTIVFATVSQNTALAGSPS